MKESPKNKLRLKVLKLRDSLSEKEREKKSNQIKNFLFSLPQFKKAKTILFYFDFRSEVKTKKMIEEALKKGKRILLPTTRKESKKLEISLIKNLSHLKPGAYGIMEPTGEDNNTISGKMVDLVIVPGCAFDKNGFRLGYGGGYYDKLLATLKGKIPLVGLAFECQIVRKIPRKSHDIPVDMIITEKRVICS